MLLQVRASARRVRSVFRGSGLIDFETGQASRSVGGLVSLKSNCANRLDDPFGGACRNFNEQKGSLMDWIIRGILGWCETDGQRHSFGGWAEAAPAFAAGYHGTTLIGAIVG